MARPLLAVLIFLATTDAAAAPVKPNDPLWPNQHAAQKIDLPRVWEETTGDPALAIAVVDTGIYALPDLDGAILPGFDFVDNDPHPEDVNSHGTRVTTVIAARGNDGTGMAGHCWGCRIIPVRVSANGKASPAAIATGIIYAVDRGARIINVSLSHPGYDASEDAAVRYAAAKGAIVVASAGNTGNDVPQYPGAYPGVLSVGATDPDDALYFWSSRGPWVMLTAPGCQTVSDARWPPGELCGTSFTPAAVSGVLGLLLSRDPSLTREQLLEAVLQTARRVPGIAYGRIDPVAAFESLGLLKPRPAVRPRPAAAAPKPQFSRQTLFESGTFRGGFQATFTVGRGRFELQLLTPRIAACFLSLASATEVIVAPPAVGNLLSLSVHLRAGRYTAAVRCRGARFRQYSLGVMAMFPQLP